VKKPYVKPSITALGLLRAVTKRTDGTITLPLPSGC
jgi:hypothetical protein